MSTPLLARARLASRPCVNAARSQRLAVFAPGVRRLATETPKTTPTPPVHEYQPSWLAQKVLASPALKTIVVSCGKLLGYGSPKQLAGRRAFVLYEEICAVRPDEERAFWIDNCYLPPTFQSWFTVTNLHVWLLIVRLRALESPAHKEIGRYYIQALIDHFFIDVEDRVRDVLQPKEKPMPPYTFRTDFYANPNQDRVQEQPGLGTKVAARAPDRVVNRQMNIFKEQWGGLNLACDLGLVQGDAELAAAIWRNILGARGAQGIDYPAHIPGTPVGATTDANAAPGAQSPRFHRAVNLYGSLVQPPDKVDFAKEEATDDGSGVHDFAPGEVDKYLSYPETMSTLVQYIRRELKRLEAVSDYDIIRGDYEKLKFGKVKPPA